MNLATQDLARYDYEGSTRSINEKRKHPDRSSASSMSRARSFPKSHPPATTAGKKLKQGDFSVSSDNYSLSSTSSKSSGKSGGSRRKPGSTSKKRREPSKCPYCNVIMTRSHDLRKHVEKLHQGPQEILCHMCNFRSTDIVLYLTHENDHLCKCPYCGFIAKNYRGLPRHKTFCRMNPVLQREASLTQGDTQGDVEEKNY